MESFSRKKITVSEIFGELIKWVILSALNSFRLIKNNNLKIKPGCLSLNYSSSVEFFIFFFKNKETLPKIYHYTVTYSKFSESFYSGKKWVKIN